MFFPLLLALLGGYALARSGALSPSPAHVGADMRMLPSPRGRDLALPGPAVPVVPVVHEMREVRPRVYAAMEPSCPPSPMAVMTELLERRQPVPPFVVQCAIAEAELAGQYQVAYALTQQFVLPMLQQGGAAPTQTGDQQGPASLDRAAPPQGGAQYDDAALEAEARGQAAPLPAAQEPVPASLAPMTGDYGPAPEVPSPVSGVPDAAWNEMLARLVRESPGMETSKHVGRYRHHKARLAEVGFDPTIIGGDPRLQDVAMATDLADCFRHLQASGTLDQALGRPITVPGHQGAVPATLSGILGVCSVAGLERAISWMDNEEDRATYPHTTMAFIRTNGVY